MNILHGVFNEGPRLRIKHLKALAMVTKANYHRNVNLLR